MKNGKQTNRTLIFCSGFCLGGVICAGLSFLFAPQTGRKTRKQIGRFSEDTQEHMAEAVDAAKESINDLVRDGVKQINAAQEDAVRALAQLSDKLKR